MNERIRWPMATYFDASTLRQLPFDLSSPELARLNEVVEKYEIGKFIPEVAEQEWILFHQEVAKKRLDGMLSTAKGLGQYVGEPSFKVEAPSGGKLVEMVGRAQEERLRTAGFKRISTPPIDIKELLEQAVKRIRPFAEGDKGFRDMVIARTIAAHAKEFAGHSILVVSADSVFDHPDVHAQWERAGVKAMVAKTLGQALEQLETAMDQAYKQYLDRESGRIKAFLVTHQQEVFDYLKGVEVSENFIKGGFLQDQAYFGTLERVRNVRPLEITRVSRGHVLSPRSDEVRRVPVTFYVKVAFDITVREIQLGTVLGGGPKFRLGDAVDLTVPKGGLFSLANFGATAEEPLREMTVEREIVVEGWLREDEHGNFTALEIEKTTTW